ncbi:MAG: hypothetical protein GKR77_05980 [Legionellales bacterium]|nr:hypothetical protein [Legionellales bacterium]
MLRQATTTEPVTLRIHPLVAERYQLTQAKTVTVQQNGCTVSLPLTLDERVAPDCVYLAMGFAQTVGLGDNYGPIELLAEKR